MRSLFSFIIFVTNSIFLSHNNIMQKGGDGLENFEEIYEEYFDLIFGFVLSLCCDKSLAEEVTQESFFKALRSIDKFRGDCKLSVWLCQIAKNTLGTELKKRKRYTEKAGDALPDHETMEEMLMKKETVKELHFLLHDLVEPYKEVFWMRTFGELSFREIGEIFGKTESWARVTYHRARLKLKEGLK